ncbi:MAG: hypothetical protein ACQEXC_02495 [Pseudomonadota bacterium]
MSSNSINTQEVNLNNEISLVKALEYRKHLQGTKVEIDIDEACKDDFYSRILNVIETLTMIEDISFSVATGLPLGFLTYDPTIDLPQDKLKTPFSEYDRFDFLETRDIEKLTEIISEGIQLVFFEEVKLNELEQILSTSHFKKINIEKYAKEMNCDEKDPIINMIH